MFLLVLRGKNHSPYTSSISVRSCYSNTDRAPVYNIYVNCVHMSYSYLIRSGMFTYYTKTMVLLYKQTNPSRKKLFKICKGENTENVCFVVFCVCKNPARLKQSTVNFHMERHCITTTIVQSL